jgi:2-dehydro-3-deoxygluconokinase
LPTPPDAASPTPELVTLGEPLGLLLADHGAPLRHARRFTRMVAGAELNVAVGLARLGHRSAFVGRVGDDAFGADVQAVLAAEGIDAGAVSVEPHLPTGVIVRDQSADRPINVLYYRTGSAGSRLRPDDVPEEWIAAARVLHLTGVTPALGPEPRAAVQRALDVARAAGVPVSFDPNFRRRLWRPDEAAEVLRPLALRAQIVLAGMDEARWLSGRDEVEDVAAWFFEGGAEVVALKCGAAGAWVTDGRTTRQVEPIRIRLPCDTIGAGDAFNAGFLSGWLRGEHVDRCGQQGVAAGAACVIAAGDLDGLPNRADLDALMSGSLEADR